MRSVDTSRHDRTDLLARPPCLAAMYGEQWSAVVVDPTDQLETLADLLDRGLLSVDEYQCQKASVLDRWPA